jgi:hypothetical protein
VHSSAAQAAPTSLALERSALLLATVGRAAGVPRVVVVAVVDRTVLTTVVAVASATVVERKAAIVPLGETAEEAQRLTYQQARAVADYLARQGSPASGWWPWAWAPPSSRASSMATARGTAGSRSMRRRGSRLLLQDGPVAAAAPRANIGRGLRL